MVPVSEMFLYFVIAWYQGDVFILRDNMVPVSVMFWYFVIALYQCRWCFFYLVIALYQCRWCFDTSWQHGTSVGDVLILCDSMVPVSVMFWYFVIRCTIVGDILILRIGWYQCRWCHDTLYRMVPVSVMFLYFVIAWYQYRRCFYTSW